MIRILWCLGLLAGAGFATARAQDPGANPETPVKLDPVVVTADLWASPLARIPAPGR